MENGIGKSCRLDMKFTRFTQLGILALSYGQVEVDVGVDIE